MSSFQKPVRNSRIRVITVGEEALFIPLGGRIFPFFRISKWHQAVNTCHITYVFTAKRFRELPLLLADENHHTGK